MANGILGKSVTTAGQFTQLYQAPSNVQYTVVNLYAVNMADTEATVSFAISLSAQPAQADYVEYTVKIPAKGGTLERTALVISANERVLVTSDNSSVAASVRGLESYSV